MRSHQSFVRASGFCVLAVIAFVSSGVAWAGGTAIVSTRGDNAIVYLCGESGAEVGRFDAGLGAHEIAVSPDGSVAVGSAYGSGQGHREPDQRLFVIDIGAKRVVRVIDLGAEHQRPNDMVFLADNRRVVVTSEVNRSVIVVDTETGEIVSTVKHGEPGGHMLAVSADGSRCFVPCVPNGKVVVIDVAKGAVIGTLEAAAGAEGVGVSPDGSRLWVANNRSQSISVFDTDEMALVATIQSDGFPFRVRFTPSGDRVVISHPQADEVRVYDAVTHGVVARVRIGPEGARSAPTSIAVSSDGSRCYAVCAATGEVAVIDLKAMKVVMLAPAGPVADGLAWTGREVG